jgi:hypothetical protein
MEEANSVKSRLSYLRKGNARLTCGIKCAFIRSDPHTRFTLTDIVDDLFCTETEFLHFIV